MFTSVPTPDNYNIPKGNGSLFKTQGFLFHKPLSMGKQLETLNKPAEL